MINVLLQEQDTTGCLLSIQTWEPLLKTQENFHFGRYVRLKMAIKHSRFQNVKRSVHIISGTQTSVSSTRYHKFLRTYFSIFVFSLRCHIFQVIFLTKNFGAVKLRATVYNNRLGKMTRMYSKHPIADVTRDFPPYGSCDTEKQL
jgi:hypothetical protein